MTLENIKLNINHKSNEHAYVFLFLYILLFEIVECMKLIVYTCRTASALRI